MNDKESGPAGLFSRQARAYAASPTHARGGDLEIVAALAAPAPGERALDIATGPGHTAFRIAAGGATVVAFDIAPGMLATARELARERGLADIRFVRGDVAALPLAAGTFDLVTCRIAPHHFPDVPGFLAEVARVLRPSGRFVLEDGLAPARPGPAAFLEDIERRRDATHVRRLSARQWAAALRAAGLAAVQARRFRQRHAFDEWIRRTGLGEAEVAAVAADIRAAPAHLRAPLFELDEGRVAALNDSKLIVLARPVRAEAAVAFAGGGR